MSKNEQFSPSFMDQLDFLFEEFGKAEQAFHDRIEDLLEEEAARLNKELSLPAGVVLGETMCLAGGWACTVIGAKIYMSAGSDDYYAPMSGTESLGAPEAFWQFTVQPPPTPKRGNVRDPLHINRIVDPEEGPDGEHAVIYEGGSWSQPLPDHSEDEEDE